MVTRQRGDLLMNIPALRKLDTMLIVCVSIRVVKFKLIFLSQKRNLKNLENKL